MTDRAIEQLYQCSTELKPPAELKTRILMQVSAEPVVRSVRKRSDRRSVRMRRWISVAACLMLVFALMGGALILRSEKYQTVYIDVNPSAALHVNRFGMVNGVEYLNEDARNTLDGVKLTGISAEDALEKMIITYEETGYLPDDGDIYISAVSEKSKQTDKLLEKLSKRAEQCKSDRRYAVNVSELTSEDRAEADAYKISPGKYRLICEIIEENPFYTVEDLKDRSMAELKAMLPKGNGKK